MGKRKRGQSCFDVSALIRALETPGLWEELEKNNSSYQVFRISTDPEGLYEKYLTRDRAGKALDEKGEKLLENSIRLTLFDEIAFHIHTSDMFTESGLTKRLH